MYTFSLMGMVDHVDLDERMIKKFVVTVLILLCSRHLLADDSRNFITLIGDKDSYIEAEVCLIDNLDLSKSTDYSGAAGVLKEFVMGLKNGTPVDYLLKSKAKKIEQLLPMSKRFYTDQQNIKFKHAVFWGRYIGLGVQYLYPDKNIPWREDFACGSDYKNCLIDFEFANDPANKIYENIYYMIVNGHVRDNTISSESVTQVNRIKLKPPFDDQDYSGTCPLFINYGLIELNKKFCLNCKDLNDQINKIKSIDKRDFISNVISKIRSIQEGDIDRLAAEKSGLMKVVGINDQESAVGIENFVSYLSSWKNIKLLGYMKDGAIYHVFVEYNFSPKKHGKLEILRFKQDKNKDLIFDINPIITISEYILYSSYFVDSIAKKYKLIDEKK